MSDETRWTAVLQRNPAAGFFYGVKTTGIYCRPSCASRRPNRANVRFFTTPTEAEDAGFRPCRKCRPADNDAPEAVLQACRLMDAAEDTPRLDDLASAVGLSPSHLHRTFKAALGVTPRAYAAARRAHRLRDGLQAESTVTDAIFAAGFASSSRCYEGDDLGMTPSDYRRGGRGLTIRHALADCYLGRLLVAATDRGICWIAFGDDDAGLLSDLARRFPGATLVADPAGFEERVARVVAFLEAPARGLDLPLDVQGTAFQRRVWQALRAVPAGTTTTYGELATRIGRPSAARAVGRAVASNQLAVAIPCHRVVHASPDREGYRWGVERKRDLLCRERNS